MFYQLKDKIKRSRFDFQVRSILETPQANIVASSPAVLLTLLQQKDLRMYLLAIKSFMAQVPISQVFVLNDGTLTIEGKAILKDHIPKITILSINDFRSTVCPTGSCWERLLSVAELVKEHHVIQLDSDTLAIGDISEVRDHIQLGTAFTLGTEDEQRIESMSHQCELMRAQGFGPNAHIQQLAEANFYQLENYEELRYVKGCAGFAGFPRRSFSVEFVEEISTQMEHAIGKKWHEWGSEQVMSNIVVANIAGAAVLPHPKYSSNENLQLDVQSFVHFIGYVRFHKGAYARLAQQVINHLLKPQAHKDRDAIVLEGKKLSRNESRSHNAAS